MRVYPPQGLSEARRGGRFFENFTNILHFSVTDPPRGRPVGGGGVHRILRVFDLGIVLIGADILYDVLLGIDFSFIIIFQRFCLGQEKFFNF